MFNRRLACWPCRRDACGTFPTHRRDACATDACALLVCHESASLHCHSGCRRIDRPVPDIAIIFNPKARSEQSRGLADQLREVAPEAELRMTEGPGDARRLAAEAARDGFRVVAAAGGDGTVNEVANGLAGTSTA